MIDGEPIMTGVGLLINLFASVGVDIYTDGACVGNVEFFETGVSINDIPGSMVPPLTASKKIPLVLCLHLMGSKLKIYNLFINCVRQVVRFVSEVKQLVSYF